MAESTSVKRLAILLPVLVLAAAGYLVLRYVMKPPTQPSMDEGRAVAESFLALIRGGKAGEAWDATTAEFKSIEGRESFIRRAKATPIFKEALKFNSSQQVMIQDDPRSEYLFQSPNAKMVRVLVGNEAGRWKVDRLTM